ncbi:MAG: TetR/AcrR family transcriptional regulator [Bacteriovoracaceae bacterium]|nr:TetR/AcrR family transcriptional regulator [Bacteriovoracaceae bacterium]
MSNTETDAKRNSILESATTLFSRRGFDGVSIRQIAEESGCNLAAISYYFGGKEKLYSECIKVLSDSEIVKICQILTPALTRADFDSKLLSFCSAFCEITQKNSKIIRIHINDLNAKEAYSPNLENTVFGPIAKAIQAFLQAGIDSKVLKQDINIFLIARILLSLMISEVVYVGLNNNFEEFSKELIKNCNGSIYA